MGRALAFQARETGSSPVTRSILMTRRERQQLVERLVWRAFVKWAPRPGKPGEITQQFIRRGEKLDELKAEDFQHRIK
jgi:hypothetical protein